MSERKVRFRCVCHQVLKAPASAQGKRVRCPTCSAKLLVPFDEIEIKTLDQLMDLSDQMPDRSSAGSRTAMSSSMRVCRHCQAEMGWADDFCGRCELHAHTSVRLIDHMNKQIKQREQEKARQQAQKKQANNDSSVFNALKGMIGGKKK